MNKFSLADVIYWLGMSSATEAFYQTLKVAGKGSENTEEKLDTAIKSLKELRLIFQESGMADCEEFANSAIQQLSKSGSDVSSTTAFLYAFRESVLRSLKKRFFVQILPDRSEYLDQDHLFGENVSVAFPSAERDIKEAGNCLAAECNTAAVFHLMRAAEFAMRALARDRNVEFKDKPIEEKEWGQILTNLESKVSKLRSDDRKLWKGSDQARESQMRFYAEVVQELRGFNDAWRRHLSHADTSAFYERDIAVGVLKHVNNFMQKLAVKISESTVTPEYWLVP